MKKSGLQKKMTEFLKLDHSKRKKRREYFKCIVMVAAMGLLIALTSHFF